MQVKMDSSTRKRLLLTGGVLFAINLVFWLLPAVIRNVTFSRVFTALRWICPAALAFYVIKRSKDAAAFVITAALSQFVGYMIGMVIYFTAVYPFEGGLWILIRLSLRRIFPMLAAAGIPALICILVRKKQNPDEAPNEVMGEVIGEEPDIAPGEAADISDRPFAERLKESRIFLIAFAAVTLGVHLCGAMVEGLAWGAGMGAFVFDLIMLAGVYSYVLVASIVVTRCLHGRMSFLIAPAILSLFHILVNIPYTFFTVTEMMLGNWGSEYAMVYSANFNNAMIIFCFSAIVSAITHVICKKVVTVTAGEVKGKSITAIVLSGVITSFPMFYVVLVNI